jgi:hypothetical protein
MKQITSALTKRPIKSKTTNAVEAPQTMLPTTIEHSAYSTASYLTTQQNLNSSGTLNEVVITTRSMNTGIPNVIASQAPSGDTPVRPLMIGLGVGVAIGLVIVIVGSYHWVKRRRRKNRECDEMMPITETGSQEW